jgi:DNA polymerase-3 subunit gamma/tau
VDRLVNAGVDLAEFMGGAGEALRALLMLQLGTEPEGLTEAMRQSLASYQDQLEPGDVVRMLRLLADSETAIRRSPNPRLIVETLLLRWAMLDRIVDLAEVLGAGSRSGAVGGASGSSGPGRGPVTRPASAGSAATSSEAPSAPRSALTGVPSQGPSAAAAAATVVEAIPAALEAVRVAWPDLVAQVRARSRFLGEALAATVPTGLDLPWLTVELAEPNPLFAERLQAQARAVEEVLERALGQPLRLRVIEATAGTSAPAPAPGKLSEAALKADRLRAFRSKDPSLDTAADALDLEIVD